MNEAQNSRPARLAITLGSGCVLAFCRGWSESGFVSHMLRPPGKDCSATPARLCSAYRGSATWLLRRNRQLSPATGVTLGFLSQHTNPGSRPLNFRHVDKHLPYHVDTSPHASLFGLLRRPLYTHQGLYSPRANLLMTHSTLIACVLYTLNLGARQSKPPQQSGLLVSKEPSALPFSVRGNEASAPGLNKRFE